MYVSIRTVMDISRTGEEPSCNTVYTVIEPGKDVYFQTEDYEEFLNKVCEVNSDELPEENSHCCEHCDHCDGECDCDKACADAPSECDEPDITATDEEPGLRIFVAPGTLDALKNNPQFSEYADHMEELDLPEPKVGAVRTLHIHSADLLALAAAGVLGFKLVKKLLKR